MTFKMPSIDTAKLASGAKLFLRQNGPTIAFAGGLALMTAGSAVAVHKLLLRKYGTFEDESVAEVMDDFKSEIDDLEYDKQSIPEDADDIDKRIRSVYKNEIKFLAKTFWLPVLMYTGGLCLAIGSYRAVGMRLVAMTAAYDKLVLANSALMAKAGDACKPDPDEVIDITKPEYTSNPDWDIDPCAVTGLPYSYWYTEYKYDGTVNPKWNQSMDSNFTMLGCTFERLNRQLQSKGYVYLNEVLETNRLALEPEGYQVGWIYSLTEDVQNQIDFFATAYIIEDGTAKMFTGDIIPENADVRIALTVVPDGSIDKAVYSRLFKTL